MKKFTVLFLNTVLCMALLMSLAVPAMATDVSVTYDGTTQAFEIVPGSPESATNLFPSFAGVMPGDTLNASVIVKNNASNKVNVKIYLRALTAEENAEFLNQMKLTVTQDGSSVLYEGPVGETGTLTDWKLLGQFKSGAEVKLDVQLEVPIEMDNEFQNAQGRFQWEFMVEEFPVKSNVPQTGDQTNLMLPVAVLGISIIAVFILLILIKRQKKEEV